MTFNSDINIVDLLINTSGLPFSDEDRRDIAVIEQRIFTALQETEITGEIPLEEFRIIFEKVVERTLRAYRIEKMDIYNQLTREKHKHIVQDHWFQKYSLSLRRPTFLKKGGSKNFYSARPVWVDSFAGLGPVQNRVRRGCTGELFLSGNPQLR